MDQAALEFLVLKRYDNPNERESDFDANGTNAGFRLVILGILDLTYR